MCCSAASSNASVRADPSCDDVYKPIAGTIIMPASKIAASAVKIVVPVLTLFSSFVFCVLSSLGGTTKALSNHKAQLNHAFGRLFCGVQSFLEYFG